MVPREDGTVELRDGRRLGFAEWGAEDGQPVLEFHGSPAGRLTRWGDPSVPERLGVRLVTVDRPGIGRSDPKAGRRPADWPDEVGQLADHLGLERFAVVGFSMGGSYAAACAASLPDRVTALGLVSSIGRVDERGVDGMGVAPYLKLARRAPWAMRAVYTGLGMLARRSPDRAHEQFWQRTAAVDREIVDRPDVRERYWAGLRDALGGRGRGLVDDMRAVQRPWGFDPAAITAPTYLFHGTEDRVVPVGHSDYWVESIPGCTAEFLAGKGHFFIEDHIEDVLRALLPVG